MGLFHGFVENLLLKLDYEVRLVFTEWLAQFATHLWGKKKKDFEAGPSTRRCFITQAVQFELVGSVRLTWDVI